MLRDREKKQKAEDRSRKLEDRSWKLEDRNRKIEDRSWKLEDRNRKIEDRSRKLEAGGWRLLASGFWLLFSVFCFAQDEFTPSLTGFIYDAKGKRNPFIPLVTADGRILNLDTQETKGPLNIEGIIYDEKGLSYAIVNSTIVKIGDIIEGYQVLKIEKDRVFFIKEGEISELVLTENKEAK